MFKKAAKEYLFPLLANGLNTKVLIRGLKYAVVHPFYHTVSNEYLPHIHPLYRPRTVGEFESHLDFLLKHFKAVSAQEVWEHQCQTRRIERPSFHLSFDDGLKEVYELALPVLQRKGVPCTVFVNTGFVDNQDLFFRYKAALLIDNLRKHIPSAGIADRLSSLLGRIGISGLKPDEALLEVSYNDRFVLDEIASLLEVEFSLFLKEQKPYLTTSQLNEMQTKGVTIGAHSIDHPNYQRIDLSEQVRQSIGSAQTVRAVWNVPQAYFAFPFSDSGISDPFFRSVDKKIDLTFGISGIREEQEGRHIGRIDMERYGRTARECIHKALVKHLFIRS